MADIYRVVKRRGKYSPLVTATVVNSFLAQEEDLISSFISAMIATFLSANSARELLGGGYSEFE